MSLASGLSFIQVDKHGITSLYHASTAVYVDIALHEIFHG